MYNEVDLDLQVKRKLLKFTVVREKILFYIVSSSRVNVVVKISIYWQVSPAIMFLLSERKVS